MNTDSGGRITVNGCSLSSGAAVSGSDLCSSVSICGCAEVLRLRVALTIAVWAMAISGSALAGEERLILPAEVVANQEPGAPANPGASKAGPTAADYQRLSRIGTGHYAPSKLPDPAAHHIERFDTSFEECAPGRNSNANEWSAFGAIGDRDFNCMGREMYVRYPLYDLGFRILDAGKEVMPDSLETFRLGLVNDRLPAIWGGWRHGDLLYKVSVMTVPDDKNGNYDLYKLQIQNPTDKPLASRLAAILEGPPDMRLEDGVVRGLGDAPFLIADPPSAQALKLRDWGLCDKRAKAYSTGASPGTTEPAVAHYRVGLDGVPVVYRVKAEPGRKYVVCLVSTPHISGYWLEKPKQAGDLVYEYRVEGCPPQTLDYVEYIQKKSQPLCVRFDEAEDKDGDGYIEIRSGVAANSRIRQTRLSVIYVFRAGTQVDDWAALYSGSMNDRCLWHIPVGATPEQDWRNQTTAKATWASPASSSNTATRCRHTRPAPTGSRCRPSTGANR